MKQTIQPLNAPPQSEPLSRLWFLSRGYEPIDPALVFGRIFYLRVKNGEVSIIDANGKKCQIEVRPTEKSRIYWHNLNPYYELKFRANGRTRHVSVAFLVVATIKHQIPDRSKDEVIDHIDGNSLNNDPRNLRIVKRAINYRDGGFMRKLRNNGYIVAMFPGIILEGYERMARWKAEHTERQYDKLRGQELLRVFVGPEFTIVDPDILMELDMSRHMEC